MTASGVENPNQITYEGPAEIPGVVEGDEILFYLPGNSRIRTVGRLCELCFMVYRTGIEERNGAIRNTQCNAKRRHGVSGVRDKNIKKPPLTKKMRKRIIIYIFLYGKCSNESPKSCIGLGLFYIIIG